MTFEEKQEVQVLSETVHSVLHDIWIGAVVIFPQFMTLEFLVPHRSDKLVTKSETHCNKSQSFIIQTTEQEYILFVSYYIHLGQPRIRKDSWIEPSF